MEIKFSPNVLPAPQSTRFQDLAQQLFIPAPSNLQNEFDIKKLPLVRKFQNFSGIPEKGPYCT